MNVFFNVFVNGQCFIQQTGAGLYLFSPLKTKLTLYKPVMGKEWGDSMLVSCAGFGKVFSKKVAPGYIVEAHASVYASHSGVLRIFTTGGNNEPNDACWIDGGNYSTAYYNVYFTVNSNQFVYAGQKIGEVIPRKDTTYFSYNIRQANPIQPLMKRAGLPVKGDKDCFCYIDPVWPEYFVNPTDWHIYWEYNDNEPQTSISVNINPSWVGKWSFDNGKNWQNSGEIISGLPQKYYKILFKENVGWKAPNSITLNSTINKNKFEFSVNYISEKTIEVSTSESVKNKNETNIDSLKKVIYDSSNKKVTGLIYNKIRDSIFNKINRLEASRHEFELTNRLLYSSFALLILLVIALVIFYYQNQKIKYQKRNVEVLQKELHHRIRNNLAIISGLIDASSNKGESNIPSKDLETRIKSISFVHEQLYQQDDVKKLNLQNFVEKIMGNLIITYANNKKVNYEIDAYLLIETRLATQLALIIAELLTNSLKHGLMNETVLKITISAKLMDDAKIEFLIADNGPGFPKNFQEHKGSSYGLKMVLGLIKQIKGEIFFSNNNGSNTRIIF